MTNDTIAAIASGLTTSGIGVIRISGSDAVTVAEKAMNRDFSGIASHTVNYGFVYDEGERVDEVLALIMRAPKSYTGETVVELQCHGGPFIMRRILDVVVSCGARIAEPGEFTKRAFLNGRLDLSQAEAVMALIDSNSEYARKAAMSQLRGGLSEKVTALRSRLIFDTAYLEAALDDPEHISLDGFGERLTDTIGYVRAELAELIRLADEGKIVREGIKTVILGKPNAGKSTLLNLLLGEERAIVTSIAGTTRDTLEEGVRLGEMALRLVDTAGLRDASDEVEKIGVNKAYNEAEDADLILYMVDGSEGLDEAEKGQIREIADRKPLILLVNKIDLIEGSAESGLNTCKSGDDGEVNTRKSGDDGEVSTHKSGDDGEVSTCKLEACIEAEELSENTVYISAKNGTGRSELEDKIRVLFYSKRLFSDEELLIANSRQKEALALADKALANVLGAVNAGMPEDLFTVDLMDAYTELGKITGESVSDDLANQIFEKFCMGK